MKLTNILLIVAFLAVGLAVFNLIITINKVGDIETLTGFATDNATVNLTVESTAVVNFTTDNINWGTGYVNETESSATLNSEGTMTGTGWTVVTQSLILENIGSSDVEVNLSSSKSAADFIGGTSPVFQWKVSEEEVGSCAGTLSLTSYTGVTVAPSNAGACTNLTAISTADELDIDIQVIVPADSASGAKGSIITAIATVAT